MGNETHLQLSVESKRREHTRIPSRLLLPELRLCPELVETLVLEEVGEQGQPSSIPCPVQAHLLVAVVVVVL